MVTKGLPPASSAPDRIYAVGDVHGQLSRLQAVHDLIREDLRHAPVRNAMLVHLGDYVDRGPDSAGCLQLLAQGSPLPEMPCVNLLGNHEQMLLNALLKPSAADLWLENGGKETLRSWGIDPSSHPSGWSASVPPNHLAFLRTLRPMFVAEPYLFVHAGVRPGIRLDMQSVEDMLWIRGEFLDWEGVMLPDAPRLRIVHGHTPCPKPELRPNRLGIDTDAARGGKLTCAALTSESVYFLQA